MTQSQTDQDRTTLSLPSESLSLIVGGLDNLHSMTRILKGGDIALLFLDEDAQRLAEIVVLGKIAHVHVERETLYIDLHDTMARARYGTIHHELGNRRAWTGHGRLCVPIIDLRGWMDDTIAPYRRFIPDDAFIDLTAQT